MSFLRNKNNRKCTIYCNKKYFSTKKMAFRHILFFGRFRHAGGRYCRPHVPFHRGGHGNTGENKPGRILPFNFRVKKDDIRENIRPFSSACQKTVMFLHPESPEGTYRCAKGTYLFAKGTCRFTKGTYLCTKGTYRCTKSTYRFAKGTYRFTKSTYYAPKVRTYSQKVLTYS
jgi:hypothetical protein